VFALVNSYRRDHGLEELRWEESLAVVCRLHCRRMAESESYLGHAGIDFRGALAGAIVDCIVYRENVGMTLNVDHPAQGVVMSWLESGSHRRNIESDATLSGVGVSIGESGACFFVQIFVKDLTYIPGEDRTIYPEPSIERYVEPRP
ncbi:CAP domain-containing protein, partial [Candidatus Fermentibacterales bacterium]|nr:CAP domain-containing protein [Candidatus Fermentibacterales bacterium]